MDGQYDHRGDTKNKERLHDHTLLLFELHPLDTHFRKRRRALDSRTRRWWLRTPIDVLVLRSTLRQRGRRYTSRTLTRRTSRRSCITRRVRPRRWWRVPSRTRTGIDQRVTVLVGELSMGLCLCLGSWAGRRLYLWTHRVRRRLFCDRNKVRGSCCARSVRIVACHRVLPDDFDHLSTVFQ